MQSQITTKSLQFVEELLNAESLAMRKCQVYAQYLTEPELNGVLNQISQCHSNRFNALNQYLSQH